MCLEKIKVNYELLAFGMQVLGLLFRLNWDLLFNFFFFFAYQPSAGNRFVKTPNKPATALKQQNWKECYIYNIASLELYTKIKSFSPVKGCESFSFLMLVFWVFVVLFETLFFSLWLRPNLPFRIFSIYSL